MSAEGIIQEVSSPDLDEAASFPELMVDDKQLVYELSSTLNSEPSLPAPNEHDVDSLTPGSSESVELRVYKYRGEPLNKLLPFFHELNRKPIYEQAAILVEELSKEQIIALFQEEPFTRRVVSSPGGRKNTETLWSPFFYLLTQLPLKDIQSLLIEYGPSIKAHNFSTFLDGAKRSKLIDTAKVDAFFYGLGYAQFYRMITDSNSPFTANLISLLLGSPFVVDFVIHQPLENLESIMQKNIWQLVPALTHPPRDDKVRRWAPIINPWFSDCIDKMAELHAHQSFFQSPRGRSALVESWRKSAPTYLVGFMLAYGNVLQKRGDAEGAVQFISLLRELHQCFSTATSRQVQFLVPSEEPSSSLDAPRTYISKPYFSVNQAILSQLTFILNPTDLKVDDSTSHEGMSLSVREILEETIKGFLTENNPLYIGPSVADIQIGIEMRDFIEQCKTLNAFACLAMITYYQSRLETSQQKLFDQLASLGHSVIRNIFPLERIPGMQQQVATLPQGARLAMAHLCGGVDDGRSRRRLAAPIPLSSSDQTTETTPVPPSPQSPSTSRNKYSFNFLSRCYLQPEDAPVTTTSTSAPTPSGKR